MPKNDKNLVEPREGENVKEASEKLKAAQVKVKPKKPTKK